MYMCMHVHVCTYMYDVYGVFSSALFCVTILYVAVDVVIAVSVLSLCMW